MPQDKLEQTLGRNVRSLRISQSLSQSELAARANVSLGALQHLERGTGSTTATLVKVLRALGTEKWLDTLGPAAIRFNPLDLLAAAKSGARQAKGPPRVRRSRATTHL